MESPLWEVWVSYLYHDNTANSSSLTSFSFAAWLSSWRECSAWLQSWVGLAPLVLHPVFASFWGILFWMGGTGIFSSPCTRRCSDPSADTSGRCKSQHLALWRATTQSNGFGSSLALAMNSLFRPRQYTRPTSLHCLNIGVLQHFVLSQQEESWAVVQQQPSKLES